MKYLQRKLRARFSGDDSYRPKNFSSTNFIPVVGFETRQKTIMQNGEEKRVEELYLIIIDDNGKLISVMAYNFRVMIDETETNIGKTSDLLNNATILLKGISDRLSNEKK